MKVHDYFWIEMDDVNVAVELTAHEDSLDAEDDNTVQIEDLGEAIRSVREQVLELDRREDPEASFSDLFTDTDEGDGDE